MAIPTSRTKEAGTVTIDREKCNGCNLCIEVCKDYDLVLENGKAAFTGKGIFECIACAHCMMICPQAAIKVSGRFTSPEDIAPLPAKTASMTYESLLALLKRRRSIREFRDRSVPREIIDQVLAAASTAPMGIPPSDVSLMVMDTKDKVLQFVKDYCSYLESLKWMVTPAGLVFMRIFYGKANSEMFRDFIKPLIYSYTEKIKAGENVVTYDAPVAIYFYSSPYGDPADPIIPATYAMLAAEALGLGTCMLGGIHPFIQNGKTAKKFREKWGIRYKSKEGLFVIMGYPKVKYHSAIERTFANVDYR